MLGMHLFRVAITKQVTEDVLIEAETAEDACFEAKRDMASVKIHESDAVIIDVVAFCVDWDCLGEFCG